MSVYYTTNALFMSLKHVTKAQAICLDFLINTMTFETSLTNTYHKIQVS